MDNDYENVIPALKQKRQIPISGFRFSPSLSLSGFVCTSQISPD